jgi:hypothetical protein
MEIDLKFIGVGIILMILSIFYDQLVAGLHQKGHQEFASLLVVGGVFYTLVLAGLVVGWVPAISIGILFIFSGAPMIVGDLRRYFKAREQEEAALQEMTRQGQEGDGESG